MVTRYPGVSVRGAHPTISRPVSIAVASFTHCPLSASPARWPPGHATRPAAHSIAAGVVAGADGALAVLACGQAALARTARTIDGHQRELPRALGTRSSLSTSATAVSVPSVVSQTDRARQRRRARRERRGGGRPWPGSRQALASGGEMTRSSGCANTAIMPSSASPASRPSPSSPLVRNRGRAFWSSRRASRACRACRRAVTATAARRPSQDARCQDGADGARPARTEHRPALRACAARQAPASRWRAGTTAERLDAGTHSPPPRQPHDAGRRGPRGRPQPPSPEGLRPSGRRQQDSAPTCPEPRRIRMIQGAPGLRRARSDVVPPSFWREPRITAAPAGMARQTRRRALKVHTRGLV